MSRAASIIEAVRTAGGPVGLSDILTALEPLRRQCGMKQDLWTRVITAQLHALAKRDKLRRSGQPRHYRYRLGPNADTDLRKRNRPGAAVPRVRPRKPAPPPKPASRSKPRPAAKPDPRTPTPRNTLPPIDLSPRPSAPAHKQTASERLAADVAAFLACGGRIQQLAPGESSEPLYQNIRELDDKRARLIKHPIDTPDDEADEDLEAA
jgi:hypothetical protein